MNSYIVTYDLIKRKDYPELFKALESYTTTWHCLGSSWIVKTDKTAAQLFDHLFQHIDADDKLIVIRLVRDAKWTGSFSEACKKWLDDNL